MRIEILEYSGKSVIKLKSDSGDNKASRVWLRGWVGVTEGVVGGRMTLKSSSGLIQERVK